MNDNNIIPSQQELATAEQLAKLAIQSGYLPRDIKTPQQAIIIQLKGRELGIPPLQALTQIKVIDGKPVISAELMMCLVYKNIPEAEVTFVETNDKKCVIKARRSKQHEYATFAFTLDDARTAGLLSKDVWKKYPAAMLRARAISSMCRALFPDAIAGASYTPEELEEIKNNEENGVFEVETRVVETKDNEEKKEENDKPTDSELRTLGKIMNYELGMQVPQIIDTIRQVTGKDKLTQLNREEFDKLSVHVSELIKQNKLSEKDISRLISEIMIEQGISRSEAIEKIKATTNTKDLKELKKQDLLKISSLLKKEGKNGNN